MLNDEETYLVYFCYLLIPWIAFSCLMLAINKKFRKQRFSLMEILAAIACYGLVTCCVHLILNERGYSSSSRLTIHILLSFLLPLGFGVGCENRDRINSRYPSMRWLAFCIGCLCVLSFFPAILMSIGFIPDKAPFRNNVVMGVIWALFLLSELGQFWLWLTRKASLNDQADAPKE